VVTTLYKSELLLKTMQEVDLKKLETELRLANKSETTIKNYIFFNQKFLEFIKKDADLASQDDVKAFLVSLDQKSRATLALAFASLKFFYETVLKKDIMQGIELPKSEKKQQNILTKEEIKQLLESADTSKSKLIMSFIYSTGLRVSEIVNLKVQDINLTDGIGHVKSGKERTFILSEKIIPDLKAFIDKHPSYQYVFSKDKPLTTRNIQKIVKLASRKAGFQKKITPYTLRYSFASHLIDSGTEMKLVQELLGSSSINKSSLQPVADDIKKIKSPFDLLYQ